MELTWSQVLSWRLRRQFLLADADGSVLGPPPLQIVRRLAGVQAQVMSAAEQAVAVRTHGRRPGAPAEGLAEGLGEGLAEGLAEGLGEGLAEGLAGGELVRTWAMRGTLHVLPVDELGTYLAPLAAARTWDKASWQKTFLDAAGMRALTDAVREILDDGAVLTREELTDAVVARAGDAGLAEHLRSGWGAVLKPLAWQGLLVQGPPREGRVTFTSPASLPGWRGLPPLDEAGPHVVQAYLGAYGPAGPAALDDWLLRGATPKKVLRAWFADLAVRGLLVEVSVEGEPLWARVADADELAAARPDASTRLLPAFDQYVLGPGTKDPHVLDPRYRAEVSRAAGWIAPVVVHAGRVVGTWEAADGAVRVRLFADAPPIDPAELAREATTLNPGLPVVTSAGLSDRTVGSYAAGVRPAVKEA